MEWSMSCSAEGLGAQWSVTRTLFSPPQPNDWEPKGLAWQKDSVPLPNRLSDSQECLAVWLPFHTERKGAPLPQLLFPQANLGPDL